MQDGNSSPAPSRPSRHWQVIAQELSGELDAQRVAELSRELSRAIEEQVEPVARTRLKAKQPDAA
jgi:hypothetical protein